MTPSPTAGASPTARWPEHVGLLAVICFFCAPLLVGLSGQDFDTDEAIYSHAVDRILDSGDWLTPRLIPCDYPFLEIPPLKFWMLTACHTCCHTADQKGGAPAGIDHARAELRRGAA